MPSKYLKMKRQMVKHYGKAKGTVIAAKTWNAKHKGTGKTVGRGRR